MDQDNINVNIGMNMDDFDGCFANGFQVSTFGPESRLDCIYIDKGSVNERSEATGKIVSRINMTTETLEKLQTLLDDHFSNLRDTGMNE